MYSQTCQTFVGCHHLVENLLNGQSKCSTPIPPNQFPSTFKLATLRFLKSPAATYTTPLSLRQVFDNFTSLRLWFCSKTHLNSLAHRDFNLTPDMSSNLTVVFHPNAQATRQEPDTSSLYMRTVLFSDISGVAVMDFESKIVSTFNVELTSIIFESSSAPFDPIESSHICNSSNVSFVLRADAITQAPKEPIRDSENG